MTTPNIALLKSQRLDDTPNGGGQMTNTIVPDNQADNLFGPISRINRAAGNVSLRKAYVMARSADTKTYFGTHIIIAVPPENDDVSVLAFTTDSWTDRRVDAVNFMESYLVQGPQTRFWLFGQQVQGARSLVVYEPVGLPLPSIGETYVVLNQSVTPQVVEYVRVTSVHSAIETFTDTGGNFELNVITLGISSPLLHTYPGAQAQRYSQPPPPALLCTTNVADAAKFYGVQMLQADAASGDATITLESVFGQLVPATRGESPITNQQPSGSQTSLASANAVLTVVNFVGAPRPTFYAGFGLFPGTLQITDAFDVVKAIDDGAGNLTLGVVSGGASIGTVDYETGKFSLTNTSFTAGGPFKVKAVPGVRLSQAVFSAQQPVTQSTRGYLYTQSLDPPPSPGTCIVSFRSGGRWYDLIDDGSGTLVGAEGSGTGTINFAANLVTATLGALPDIGSNVVFSWGTHQDYDVRTGDITIEVPAVSITLAHPAEPGSITITWNDGSVRTVTDDGNGGLTGFGTGSVAYGAGAITLRPTTLPASAVGFSVAYQSNPATNATLNPTKSGGLVSFTLSGAPIAPHTFLATYQVTLPASWPANIGIGYNADGTLSMRVFDNGSGNLVSNYSNGVSIGTINYTTGVVSFNPDFNIASVAATYALGSLPVWDPTATPPAYTLAPRTIQTSWTTSFFSAAFTSGDPMLVSSTASGASTSSRSESFAAPGVHLDLTPFTVEPITPGSVMFKFTGDTYVDRAGQLYRSIDPFTNAAVLAGTIDYQTGQVVITSFPAGAANFSLLSLLCNTGVTPIGYLSGRVAGQSVRPSSFFIQANRRTDGAIVNATADVNGDIASSGITGHIDVTTGFYNVQFGARVLDSSLSPTEKAEPWYNAAAVDGTGHIWRPNEALPGTIRISCVVETTLPLSSSVLGLDPVRLPIDGRVPIFRAGDTLVFRNPLVYSVSGTPVASQVFTLPRGDLESAVLFDADGTQVDTAQYSVDLTAGTVTMASSGTFSLSGYTGPYTITHTVGEMVLCVDAQITGQVDLSPALVNAYPAASSYVSSALIFDDAGDLEANYDTLFMQTTWNFNPDDLWDDQVHGTTPTAAFNDLGFPIQVLDRDAITQRWALIFTSATAGNVAGEHLGVIGTFSTSTNVAPLNPATGNPYFVMDHGGFGTGWQTANAIRFNTIGAGGPVWFSRSVQVGAAAMLSDGFTTQVRWDE